MNASKRVPRPQWMQDASASGESGELMHAKRGVWRSEQLKALVRKLPCVRCGLVGFTQAAHSNLAIHGKGGRLKASDAAIMALCGGVGSNGCHEHLDSGKHLSKYARQAITPRLIVKTYMALANAGLIGRIPAADADRLIKAMEAGEIAMADER